mmetsp:Transcript_96999/g.250884  ORF Transcript_96999/g.250884 Transcript_96999/m.250884 type:complete len:220 (+) Transcript_96999:948-1607(+)
MLPERIALLIIPSTPCMRLSFMSACWRRCAAWDMSSLACSEFTSESLEASVDFCTIWLIFCRNEASDSACWRCWDAWRLSSLDCIERPSASMACSMRSFCWAIRCSIRSSPMALPPPPPPPRERSMTCSSCHWMLPSISVWRRICAWFICSICCCSMLTMSPTWASWFCKPCWNSALPSPPAPLIDPARARATAWRMSTPLWLPLSSTWPGTLTGVWAW